MSALARSLARYGEYHRNRRNVATHLVGIPMIVLAVMVLLSRPYLDIEQGWLTPARVLMIPVIIFYLRLDIRFGIVMAVLLSLGSWAGLLVVREATATWLGWGIGLFVVGWIFQFVGHAFEGRKPAFVDDIKSLLVGPLFVVAEVAFMLGLRKQLQAEMEQREP